MLRFCKGLFAGVGALMLLAAPTMVNAQEDCHRGTLDVAYCDRNLDQLADLPLDPKDWVDPSTIIFTYTPVEDPAVYANIWQGFVDHMAKTTGRKVAFFPVQSNAAQLEAMRSGRLHVAGFNTGSNPIAVSCAGFVPFGMMAYKDGKFGYEMEIIVPADSDMQSQFPYAKTHWFAHAAASAQSERLPTIRRLDTSLATLWEGFSSVQFSSKLCGSRL